MLCKILSAAGFTAKIHARAYRWAPIYIITVKVFQRQGQGMGT